MNCRKNFLACLQCFKNALQKRKLKFARLFLLAKIGAASFTPCIADALKL
jgi:hypothetical protein